MDPNECLKRQRELARDILRTDSAIDRAAMSEDLAALVVSLDEWLVAGGFPPHAWRRNRTAPWPFGNTPRVPQSFAVGERVRLHSGKDTGTVERDAGVRVLVRWDSGSYGSWHKNELEPVEPSPLPKRPPSLARGKPADAARRRAAEQPPACGGVHPYPEWEDE